MARRKVKNGEKSPWGQCLTRLEARTAATVRNWSGKTLSPGALLAVLYFSSCHIFFRPFRLFLVPTICLWVSEDDIVHVNSLVEIAAKGSALQMYNVNETFPCNSTYASVLQPNPCLTNKTVSQANSTSTTDNTDNG